MGNRRSRIANKKEKEEELPSISDLQKYADENNQVIGLAHQYLQVIKKKNFLTFSRTNDGDEKYLKFLILGTCEENENLLIRELNKLTKNKYFFCTVRMENGTHRLCIDTTKDNDGFSDAVKE